MDGANAKCRELIAEYKSGSLARVPGCDLELSLEQMIGKELDGVRNEVSSAAKGALHYDNKVRVLLAVDNPLLSIIETSHSRTLEGFQILVRAGILLSLYDSFGLNWVRRLSGI